MKGTGKSKILLLFLISSIYANIIESHPQTKNKSTISGRVTDSVTREPISYINIFLANTTLGSSTNKDGRYIIRNIPPGIYELIISHISYELLNVQLKLLTPDLAKYNFSLKQRLIVGEGINVIASVPKDWKKDLKKFTGLFIGKTHNSKNCYIINPEVIDFETSEAGNFIAFTDSVIRVENRSLGYHIDVILRSFQYQENTKDLEFVVYPKFRALKAQNDNELKDWYENRSNTYYGSFKHFMKSLSKGISTEEGFLLSYSSKPEKLGIGSIDPSFEELLEPYVFGMSRFYFDGILNVFHKKAGNSWIKIEDPLTLVDLEGNHNPQDGIRKWGAWSRDRIADLLPLDYDPKIFVFTPNINRFKEIMTSKSKNEIQGELILEVLDELVFKESEHGELIDQLHEDIIALMNDDDAANWKILKTNIEKAKFLRRFWLLRDMSFGTKTNERLEEHYKRLQFARTMYSALSPSGYDDRGRIFVKYGQPDGKISDVNPGFGKSNETWVYQINGKQITFDFIDKIYGYSLSYRIDESIVFTTDPKARLVAMARLFQKRQDLSLRHFNLYNLSEKALFESLSDDAVREMLINIDQQLTELYFEQVVAHSNLPTIYSNQFEGFSELKFSLKPALFENNQYEHTLALAYGFKENDIGLSKSINENLPKIRIKTVIRDLDLNDITMKEDTISAETAKFDENREMIHQVQIPIVDNTFYILAGVSNLSVKQKGFQDYSIRNPRYTNQQLHLSSVIFAKEISPFEIVNKSEKSSQLIRNDFDINMYPFSEIRAKEPIFIYFEIYSLQKNESGETQYEIEYTVAPEKKKQGFMDFVAKLNPFRKVKGAISISYTQEGGEINDYFSIKLDFSQLDPGNYEIVIKVKDKIANESKETKTSFVLM